MRLLHSAVSTFGCSRRALLASEDLDCRKASFACCVHGIGGLSFCRKFVKRRSEVFGVLNEFSVEIYCTQKWTEFDNYFGFGHVHDCSHLLWQKRQHFNNSSHHIISTHQLFSLELCVADCSTDLKKVCRCLVRELFELKACNFQFFW